ncbi:MAG: LamG domain-containing protein [Verrucomicrobia bacterium]|nr:LamG domain-containing protein [Verrucomicrobiota bacterium]
MVARLHGTARWGPGQGKLGGALELDGTRGFVEGGDAPEFGFCDRMTVSLWMKAGGSKKTAQTLVAKGNDTWQFHSEGDQGQLVFAITGPRPTGKDKSKATRVTTKRAVGDGQWHHVVGVYDGQRVAVYVDGVLDGSVAASGPLALNTEPVWLGDNSAARGQSFNGLLDDVRLYAYGLSEEEIKALSRTDAK